MSSLGDSRIALMYFAKVDSVKTSLMAILMDAVTLVVTSKLARAFSFWGGGGD